MDRYLLSGAFALLIIESLVLLADLNVIDIGWQPFSPPIIQQENIGYIVHAKQNVRRRGQESIVWESTDSKDLLYDFDSVLTLSQSSAQIKLRGDVQIQLHENTLVVLEPPEETKNDQLRLRFSRGNVRARNKKPIQMLSLIHISEPTRPY